jgi:hypothetical protein
MEWSPTKGPMYTITVNYLTRLIVELEENKLSTSKNHNKESKQEGKYRLSEV